MPMSCVPTGSSSTPRLRGTSPPTATTTTGSSPRRKELRSSCIWPHSARTDPPAGSSAPTVRCRGERSLSHRPNRRCLMAMNLTLWIATWVLAAVALLGGVTKTFVPKDKLAEHDGGRWTARASVGFVKTLGVLELLAAVGLILPGVLDIAPVMVPVTAACWVVLMVGAMITHGRLGQIKL